MALFGLWERLREKIRQEGLGYALQSLSRRIPNWLFQANAFVVFALKVPTTPPEAAEYADVREAGPADVKLLAINRRSKKFICNRFEKGARAWIEEDDGRLVGHAWADPHNLLWDHCLELIGAPGDIWSIDGWVAPDQRGKGCYARIKGMAAFESGQAGYERLLAAVDVLNRNSIRANTSIGSTVIGRGSTIRLFGLTLVFYDGMLRIGFYSETKPLKLRVNSEQRR